MVSAGASKSLTLRLLFTLTTGKLVLMKSVGTTLWWVFPSSCRCYPTNTLVVQAPPSSTDYSAGSVSKCLAHVQWGRNPMEKRVLRVEIAARGMSGYRFPNRSRDV